MKHNFPSPKDITDMSNKLSRGIASTPLSPHATDLEKLKYEICRAFVIYKKKHRLSQRDLANELSVNEAVISKIVHYKIENFTVDRLMKYLSSINSHVTVKVKVA